MTEVLHPGHDSGPAATPDSVSDAELIALVRAGDSGAYEQLFLRHRDVALRYARRLTGIERAEDLCAEAFTKILDLLQRGKGPDVAFRAYLLTTVRTSHLNTLRAGGREDLVPDHEPLSRMTPVHDDPDARFDRQAIFRAFSQLPERWQTALWMTAVEGRTHDEVSEQLGIKSNAVASLAFRARAGLRQAYLAEHLLDTGDPQCRIVIEQLPSYLRERLTSRRRAQVDEHLKGCVACTTAALEISEVDSHLGALLAPLLATGFTVGTAAGAHATGVLAVVKGLVGTVLGNAQAVGAAAPGVIGAKSAAVLTVTALSVAVGAEVVHQQATPPTRAEAPVTARLTPADVGRPVAASPKARPTPTPSQGSEPAVAELTTAPPAAPTPTAESSDTVPESNVRAARVGEPTQSQYDKNNARWERMAVPVDDAPAGTTLFVTTNRTIQTTEVETAGTGWTCDTPLTVWPPFQAYATTVVSCERVDETVNAPLVFSYNVLTNAAFVAKLTVPKAYQDTNPDDNRIKVRMRT